MFLRRIPARLLSDAGCSSEWSKKALKSIQVLVRHIGDGGIDGLDTNATVIRSAMDHSRQPVIDVWRGLGRGVEHALDGLHALLVIVVRVRALGRAWLVILDQRFKHLH